MNNYDAHLVHKDDLTKDQLKGKRPFYSYASPVDFISPPQNCCMKKFFLLSPEFDGAHRTMHAINRHIALNINAISAEF